MWMMNAMCERLNGVLFVYGGCNDLSEWWTGKWGLGGWVGKRFFPGPLERMFF